jgi:hypothetical protein
MQKTGIPEGINNPKTKQILLAFSMPKTPKQVQTTLSIRKIKLKPFIEKGFLECLNPKCRKGRFYVLTQETRERLGLECQECDLNKNWELIGWIMASPKQRLIVLRFIDERKLCSEEVRMRATQLTRHLTRESTKVILKDLINKHLAGSEILERIRFYWITQYGQKIKDEMAVLSPLTQTFF